MMTLPNQIHRVVTVVSNYYGITPAEMIQHDRHRLKVEGRSVIIFILRMKYRLTLKEIGSVVGRRHHATILHSVTRVENMVEQDPKFAALLSQLLILS